VGGCDDCDDCELLVWAGPRASCTTQNCSGFELRSHAFGCPVLLSELMMICLARGKAGSRALANVWCGG
jgi:hypothetical protein